MHRTIDPAILYFGTPVVLVSTLNANGTANLAPMSSAWWIGHRCVLGLAVNSKTTENLLRDGACVLNLASEAEVDAVDRLALTTGTDPVPDGKQQRGYRFEADKFGVAGLTPMDAEIVRPPRVAECLVHLEATVYATHELAAGDSQWGGRSMIFETQVKRVHVDDSLRLEGHENRIDPDRWRPLFMSFQQLYGMRPGRLRPSRLASISEAKYR